MILKEDYELRVKIISSSYWPETCTPIKTSFNLINTIKNLNSNRPIVVHDHFGGHRAGKFDFTKKVFIYVCLLATFCMLYTMKEQIENEGILNVYELAKFYHIKRPGIWRHKVRKKIFFLCIEICLLFSRVICYFYIVVQKFFFMKINHLFFHYKPAI
jgi:receptor-type tyrosine-protein phosphatase gamma